ncbi:MAG: hypothetical protein NUV61_00865 [Candidatus Azambacteria bacterium]|nr:hypothetical protein [Candidatus Azambacteria bacterium]
MEECKKHSREIHYQIERIAERYIIDTGVRPVVSAVILPCDKIEEILENIAARAKGPKKNHCPTPRAVKHNDGSPQLFCKRCGDFLTLEVEDAYREVVLKRLSCEKHSPQS